MAKLEYRVVMLGGEVTATAGTWCSCRVASVVAWRAAPVTPERCQVCHKPRKTLEVRWIDDA